MRFVNPKKALVAAVAAAVSGPQLAAAETFVLEELVVTAQKREQNLQDVPVSVNVVGGEAISEGGIGNLEEMSALVPNLSINQSPQNLSIYVRGLGSGDNQGFEQSVGLFIDGVYAGRSKQFQAPFMDVASVEVLRGPQGTLFGKNTIAGAMTVNTAKPTDDVEMLLKTSYEPRYNSYDVEGVISGPITDTLKGRLAVSQSETGGYLKNTNAAIDDDEPEEQNAVVRGTLVWDASDDLEVIAKYEWGHSESTGRGYRMDGVGVWGTALQAADPNWDPNDESERTTNTEEEADTNSDSFTLTMNYALGEYELTSITGYSEFNYDEVVDGDSTSLDALRMPQSQEFDQWSQELRLTSPLGGDIDFIAGLYFQTSDFNLHRRIDTRLAEYAFVDAQLVFVPEAGAYSDYEQESETYAAFGSVTWHATEQLHLTGGLRYTIEEKDAKRNMVFTGYDTYSALADVYDPAAPAGPFPANEYGRAVGGMQLLGVYEHDVEGDRRAENVSPSLKVQYDLSDDVMLYASISKAFKSGGYNAIGNQGDDPGEYGLSPNQFDFDEEEALAFELGGKTVLMDGAAQLNFALFRTEYTDLQVSNFQGDTFIVGNAAEAISQGLEVDGTMRLSETLFLNASFAYLDAHYSKYEDASCTAGQLAATAIGQVCSQDLTDKDLANAPEWSGNIGLDQEFILSDNLLLRTHVDVAYTGEQYLSSDLDDNSKEDSHITANARVALSDADGSWEVALVGKNLTDEEIRTWSNDPLLLTGAHFSYYAPPRTVAVQFNLKY
ncbi:TonB-dependent receptor [Maricurvus nonylphenolicus]|uniref:TonB-dependent receptor n=1 Tax=Maricurvus nonylphenolicus TaxID=1008307 RepID=UPI0036F3EB88